MAENYPSRGRFKIKFILLIFVIITASLADAWARDYRVRKKKSGYTVDVSINKNPPILGDNDITIQIKDAGGKNVKDARVLVNYYMPPMPGMPPMNYNVFADPQGDQYRATMDLIMTGPWNIVIKVKRAGKLWRISFPIDVR